MTLPNVHLKLLKQLTLMEELYKFTLNQRTIGLFN